MKVKPYVFCLVFYAVALSITLFLAVNFGFAQGSTQESSQQEIASGVSGQATAAENESQQSIQPVAEESKDSSGITDSLAAAENVSLDFKEADINNVLKIISYKAGINIVSMPDVVGNVTIKLVDVPWEQALEVILKTYGFGYQKQGNIILVAKIENMIKIQSEESLKTEIIKLKFLDAQDAMKILIPLLSNRGKISMLYTRGQKGWSFGTFQIGGKEVSAERLKKQEEEKAITETIAIEKNPAGGVISTKADFEPSIKSKTLLVTDTAASIERIHSVILPQIDKKPRQVVIESKIIEVNLDTLKDIGFDWGTGSSGAESSIVTNTRLTGKNGVLDSSIGGHSLGGEILPAVFGPKANDTVLGIKGYEPYNIGLELIFKKLTGTQFEAIFHALSEDINTNILSAPRIMTLDNQEAAILVGYHTPILKSEISGGSSTEPTKITQTLSYYQEIGIRLNVVPQISEEGYINMIVHPSVTSSSSNVTATSMIGTSQVTSTYPVIDVRETQTQILIKDGETIVMGGLLKDKKSKGVVGIPFLSKIPLLGQLFQRETTDTEKIDLLIFLSAHVVKDDEFPPEEIAKLHERMERPVKVEVSSNKKAKKK